MSKEVGLFIPTHFENIIDGILHLQNHDELYWTVGKSVNKCHEFSFPITGLLYLDKKGDVRCKCKIKDIIPFSKDHYKHICKKPKRWISDWKKNKDKKKRKTTLIITKIESFYYKATKLKNHSSKNFQPSQNCIRIYIPKSAVTNSRI